VQYIAFADIITKSCIFEIHSGMVVQAAELSERETIYDAWIFPVGGILCLAVGN
jgi:hypothetical protein